MHADSSVCIEDHVPPILPRIWSRGSDGPRVLDAAIRGKVANVLAVDAAL